MKKILVIGCPGAGKSTFSRKLSAKTGIPLTYLDMIWHRPDRSNIGRQALVERIRSIMEEKEWIIDGNYIHTLELRLSQCDTVFFFDIPVETCLSGAIARLGKPRVDMPWTDKELDEEFRQFILDFEKDQKPEIERMLSECDRKVVVFHSREEADDYISTI